MTLTTTRALLLMSTLTLLQWVPSDLVASDQESGHDHSPPRYSDGVRMLEDHENELFRPDPSYEHTFDFDEQKYIYGEKWRNPTQRPIIALGNRPLYIEGDYYESPPALLGEKNPIDPWLLVFGDWRAAAGINDSGAVDVGRLATKLTLDFDVKLTATERIHAIMAPFDKAGKFTRYDFSGDFDGDDEFELDGNLDAIFFEGDLGALYGGATGQNAPFDMPIAFGKVPLLFQNGVWLEDAPQGFAFTIPARNSSRFNISNYDITFFAAFDEVNSPAVLQGGGNDHDAAIFGVATFIEANKGYWEAGYGYTEGEDAARNLDYHNVTLAFTRRYEPWISNSMRVIYNFGQDESSKTADGVLLLLENSFITSSPSTVVPYLNMFAGFNRPQSLSRGAAAGGVLENTGLNFEGDAITAFPNLDATGHDTVGAALGLELLLGLGGVNPAKGGQMKQVVFEVAGLHRHGSKATAPDDEVAVGARFQWPLSHRFIFRADAMYGIIEGSGNDNLGGIRFEFRWKF